MALRRPAPTHDRSTQYTMTSSTPPPERNDVIKIGDKPATVIGSDVRAGDKAPRFTASANNWAPVDVIGENAGKVVIIAAVPSLDTAVCDTETRRFNEEAAGLGDDIRIYVLSTDFPMAQKRWCGNAGVDRVFTVSDVLNAEFGIKYGLLVKERRYLRRAVFVVDRQGTLRYVDYMKSLGDQPNYEAVLAAAKALL